MQHHRWKAALVALALGLSGVVAACGDDEEEPAGGGGASGGGEDYDMTLIAGVKGDEFYITMNCGAQEKAQGARRQRSTSRAPTSSTPRCRRRSSTRSRPRSPTRS